MKTTLKQLASLLDAADRRAVGLFVLISFLAGVIEVAGIGSVMPFIAVLMQPGLATTNRFLAPVYAALHFSSPSPFILLMGGVTLAVIVAGGVINILSVRYQTHLSYRIGYKWAARLFAAYLSQPYRFFLNVNSSAMKSGILAEVDRAISCVLIPAAVLISRGMVLIVIFALLLLVNAGITALLMLVVGGIYGALLAYFRRRMRRQGDEITAQNKIKFQAVNEAFASIRDIKLYHSNAWFEEKFSAAAEKSNMAQAEGLYIGQVPRFVIEIAGFAALIGIALWLVVIGENPAGHVIPVIALFAAAGYKVLPAAQNLYSSLTFIRLHGAALSAVAEGVNLPPSPEAEEKAADFPFENGIEIRGLSFAYDGQEAPALREVNCTIRKNTLVAVTGPTGAGKSTLVDLLAGLLQPDAGYILVDGQPLSANNVRAWQRQSGYVPQKIHLLDDSIENNIAFAVPRAEIDAEWVRKAAAGAKIDDFIRSLPEAYGAPVGESGDRLSGGQRQRIGIARALYRDPAVLILDEPTSALDADTARALLATLKDLSREKTVILITHAAEALPFCDQILSVSGGRVWDGKAG